MDWGRATRGRVAFVFNHEGHKGAQRFTGNAPRAASPKRSGRCPKDRGSHPLPPQNPCFANVRASGQDKNHAHALPSREGVTQHREP